MSDASDLDPTPVPARQADTLKEDADVEIHKPKPVHSWRELLSEIGVVVIGVCIALAAEQAVEWVHWREQAANARSIISGEIAANIQDSIDIMRGNACTERRLDQLEGILATAAKTAQLPPLGEINQPPARLFGHGAWDSFVASQAASHLDRVDLAAMGTHYAYGEQFSKVQQEMIDAWNTLEAIVGPGRPTDAQEIAALQVRVSQARGLNRELALLSTRMLDASTQQIAFSQSDAANIKAEFQTDLKLPICGPMGRIPNAYGQGFGSATIGDVDAAIKNPPKLKLNN
jgi:hypothetical protein